ncbi:MAG: hypothetical protein AAF519_16790 [Bacteroidota bacterium]
MATVIKYSEILGGQRDESIYYYQNNWKLLRISAQEKGVIHSFQPIEIEYAEEIPAHLVLLTKSKNKSQYHKAEENFKAV